MYVTLVASTHTAQAIVQAPMPLVPGDQMLQNYTAVLIGTDAGAGSAAPVGRMMFVSLVSALTIALGKIAISLLSAFAIVYFRFPFRNFFLGDLRHADAAGRGAHRPHYEVVSDLGMLNSYAGLTVPLIASATATFLFRQFFLTVPDELAEAARIDGAGPMRFFWDGCRFRAPALRRSFVIQFIYGWNQYCGRCWSQRRNMYPVVMGIKRMIAGGDAPTTGI